MDAVRCGGTAHHVAFHHVPHDHVAAVAPADGEEVVVVAGEGDGFDADFVEFVLGDDGVGVEVPDDDAGLGIRSG